MRKCPVKTIKTLLWIPVCLILFIWLCCPAAAEEKTPSMFITCTVEEGKLYEHQPVTASVTLYTETPDVAFINRLSDPKIEKKEFESIRAVELSARPVQKVINGRKYYEVPIEAFVFSIADKGSYTLDAPSYRVGVAERVIVRDPFWGDIPSSRTKSIDLSARDSKFKINSIPAANAGEGFSGSLGDFTIKTVVPDGNIYVGEEATAYVIISGPGMIGESVMPEYRSAFDHSLRLKSVSETRGEKFVDGRYVSELTLEITFIPDSRDDSEIGPVSFDFFNTTSGRHTTIKSSPVKVNVTSSTIKREKIEI